MRVIRVPACSGAASFSVTANPVSFPRALRVLTSVIPVMSSPLTSTGVDTDGTGRPMP